MCESLAYLVQSEHYVTSANFGSCLRCIWTFSEVSASSVALEYDRGQSGGRGGGRQGKVSPTRSSAPPPAHIQSGTMGGSDTATYTTTSLQLLDLMDTLYFRVTRIFNEKTITRLESEMTGEITSGVVGDKPSDHSVESKAQESGTANETTFGQVANNEISNLPAYSPEAIHQDTVSSLKTSQQKLCSLEHPVASCVT